MSQENVEIVRELYAGWVRGDFSVGREHFDPDVEFATSGPPTASPFGEPRRCGKHGGSS